MKNKFIYLLFIAVCFGAVACSDDEGWPADGDYPITFGSDTILTLNAKGAVEEQLYSDSLGYTNQITILDYLESDPPIFYSTDNEYIATVSDSGFIKAMHVGSAIITVKNAFEEHTVELTVEETKPMIDSIPDVDFEWDRYDVNENIGTDHLDYQNEDGYLALIYPNFTTVDVQTEGSSEYESMDFDLCFVFEPEDKDMVYYGLINSNNTSETSIPDAIFTQKYAAYSDSTWAVADTSLVLNTYIDAYQLSSATIKLAKQTSSYSTTEASHRNLCIWYSPTDYEGPYYSNWE